MAKALDINTLDLDNLPTTKKALDRILAGLDIDKGDRPKAAKDKKTLIVKTVETLRAMKDDADDAGLPEDMDNAYTVDAIRDIIKSGKAPQVKTACAALGIEAKSAKAGKKALAGYVEGIEADPAEALSNLASSLRKAGGFLAALTIDLALEGMVEDADEDEEEETEEVEETEYTSRAKRTRTYLLKNGWSESEDDDTLVSGDDSTQVTWTGDGWTLEAEGIEGGVAFEDLTGKKLSEAIEEALAEDEGEEDESDAQAEVQSFLATVIESEDADTIKEAAKDLNIKGRGAKSLAKKLQAIIDDEESDWEALRATLAEAGWQDFSDGEEDEEDETEEDEGDDEEVEEEDEVEAVTVHYFRVKADDDTFYCLHGGKNLRKAFHTSLTAKVLRAAGFNFDAEDDNCWYVEKSAWGAAKDALTESAGDAVELTFKSKKQG